jgi:pentatricopeptide repeat protein
MRTNDVAVDAATYNTVMVACVRSCHPHKAWQLFHRMRRDGLAPDKFTFNALLSICQFAEDPWAEAGAVLEAMQVKLNWHFNRVFKGDAGAERSETGRASLVTRRRRRGVTQLRAEGRGSGGANDANQNPSITHTLHCSTRPAYVNHHGARRRRACRRTR